MEGLGKLLPRSGVAFVFVFVVLGSVVLSPAAAARATVGFPPEAADREAGRTGALARPREVASTVGRGGAGVAENERVKAGENYYASMLLNAMPRGQSPPSGPSPQINYVKT